MKFKNLKKRILTSALLLSLSFLMIKSIFFLLFSLIVLGVLSLIEFFGIIKKIFKSKLIKVLVNLTFIFYVSMFCVLFFIFANFIHLKIIIFTILLGCIGSDVGGFIAGKIFKGPKLTKISPNKTYSGAAGSFLLTMSVIPMSFFYFTNNLNFKIFIFSFIISLACQLGDLFFSLLKRKAKIKDTGNFLPGHGGVLDRLDGILFGLPVGLIILLIFSS